ncbi:putative OTU domain-containing protein [Zostera marina]|uniref:Putative OTU domain-containing protein n=1 Tax=Zostera marina TaxID=29655 RepID=A0A0K9Q5I5_ZOSMR|nr:putative OTU domain-containing protein [Zostera marina]
MAQNRKVSNSSKSKKDIAQKKGKQTDSKQIQSQLDLLGLKIIEVVSDGNCFFRALAEQLDGNQEQHEKYRHMVVQYIIEHKEDFEPFIEDDVPFETYCKSMNKDGTWAGHMELQASSLIIRSNICIHRFMSPRWYIINFKNRDARMIHLSYHDGEHYNSIRWKDDHCNGRANSIDLKAINDDLQNSENRKTGFDYEDVNYESDTSVSNSIAYHDSCNGHDEKKLSKEIISPQQSKRKQKTRSKFVKKDKRNGKKGKADQGSSIQKSCQLPDLGALCI